MLTLKFTKGDHSNDMLFRTMIFIIMFDKLFVDQSKASLLVRETTKIKLKK